ncbi:MAG: DUF5050 domain-containing protein [Oscillospiraceae bacterium]|nr:DUF5050 domain-containing protein [Oscillospiraceae bacterium]
MKYRILLLILIILIISLMVTTSACSGSGSAGNTAEPEPIAASEPSPEVGDHLEPEPAALSSTYLTDAIAEFPGLSAEQTAAMSNWAQYGFGLIENNIYYGRFFLKGESAPMLFSIELKTSKRDIKPGMWQVLDSEHSPKYMVKQSEMLYYIMLDRNTGKSLGIGSVGLDGSNAKVLYEGECDYLSIAGKMLFFTNGNGYPSCLFIDGRDPHVLLDRRVFYLYGLSEEWLIFQDDTDGESLHLFHISDGADIKLTDEAAFNPVILGTSLFFSTRDPGTKDAYHISCINLANYSERYNENKGCFEPVFTLQHSENTFGGEFYISGDTIWAMNNSEPIALKNWVELKDDASDGFNRIMRFVSNRWIVEEIIGKDGGITAIMFHDRNGKFASKIPWLS